LSVSVLIEASTPRQLARIVFERNSQRISPYVIHVKPDGKAPPIFCVHGTNGESIAPHTLSALIPDQQFFAFRAVGLEERERIQTSVEEIASTYVAGMATVQGRSGAIILGHCSGAIIALEMAQQLTNAGEPPLGLILIDPSEDVQRAPYLHAVGLGLSVAQANAKRAIDECERVLDDKGDNLTGQERRKLATIAIEASCALYVPRTYDGETLFFHSPDRVASLLNKSHGYQTFIRNLEAVDLGTNHYDMFDGGLEKIEIALRSFIENVTISHG
jgi:thioesterase domain-containing protein